MSQTYGLLSDIHANDVALQVALEQLDQQGVDDIICAGDIMGYGGCPNETISLLKKKKIKAVLGNYDFYFLTMLLREKQNNQFVLLPELMELALKMKFREIGLQMLAYQQTIISKTNIQWLSKLPVSLTTTEKNIYCVHGAPPVLPDHVKFIQPKDYLYAINKYLFPWEQENLSLSCHVQPTNTMVIGHTHMQFAHQSRHIAEQPIKTAHPCLMKYGLFPIRKTFEKSYPLLINPGSIGQSRDEIEAPGYATIKFQGKNKRIVTWYRYMYDFNEFTTKMRSKNAPQEIFDREFWNLASNY